MSQELLLLIQQLNSTQLERQLVMQCAPVFAGEKISNLFIIPNHNEDGLEKLIRNSEFRYYRLLRTPEKTTYLIFHKEKLEQWLWSPKVQRVLKRYGYSDQRLGTLLLRFQLRYQEYMKEHQSFPHEMGLILGYPIEDVVGFIEHQGKNYLYSGYWKVYKDAGKKIKTFKRYEAAMNEQVSMLSQGMNINEIIRFYDTNKQDNQRIVS